MLVFQSMLLCFKCVFMYFKLPLVSLHFRIIKLVETFQRGCRAAKTLPALMKQNKRKMLCLFDSEIQIDL